MYGNNLVFFLPCWETQAQTAELQFKKISETSKVFNRKWRFELTADFQPVLQMISVAPTQEHESSYWPSSLSCTVSSSSSSSPPSAWLSPPRPPAACISPAGREYEFLCAVCGFVVHRRADPCRPHGADNSLHACLNWCWRFGVATALRHEER